MSLYFETAPYLEESDQAITKTSLKSRIFARNDAKNPARQIYALASEASRWSEVLAEVIDRTQLMESERKLTPTLALLLVHDLLLSKHGISAPASHPLRVAVERHKARLSAELTRVRIKKGFTSLDGFRSHMKGHVDRGSSGHGETVPKDSASGSLRQDHSHPRWIRVNTLKTTLEEQLRTTFKSYRPVETLDDALTYTGSSGNPLPIYLDKNIPNLFAISRAVDITISDAYDKGLLILQDKASCFPAYMLDPDLDGLYVDACAAPGNKTTHLAGIVHDKSKTFSIVKPRILACERDKSRATTLRDMVWKAGANDFVRIHAGQDFLNTKMNDEPWCQVTSLLLDPSCSGSGIIGRDEARSVVLPRAEKGTAEKTPKKRKRKPAQISQERRELPHENILERTERSHNIDELEMRLTALSKFQLKLLLHAFEFPKARRITYSTCSIYGKENEEVVVQALLQAQDRNLGWRLIPREEQVAGMKSWPIRGDAQTVRQILEDHKALDAEMIAQACIRCEKGSSHGTQGFFVAAFARDLSRQDEEEWEGCSDDSQN